MPQLSLSMIDHQNLGANIKSNKHVKIMAETTTILMLINAKSGVISQSTYIEGLRQLLMLIHAKRTTFSDPVDINLSTVLQPIYNDSIELLLIFNFVT
jgi:hypothetical protein